MYVQSDRLLLTDADVFDNLFDNSFVFDESDPDRFLTAPVLAWQASLKKYKLKLNLLSAINMLLMVEKGIRGGICHAIHRYAKAYKKYMKDCDNIKESSHLKYWDVNNLY